MEDSRFGGRNAAIVALCLLVPAPSIGVVAAMFVFPDSIPGTLIFGACKLWVFALPVLWLKLVQKRPLSFSPPLKGGFGAGLASGILISALILAVYLAAGDRLIEKSLLAGKLTEIGLGNPARYLAGAAYWILVNSVLEEYVWRWFCFSQCRELMGPRLSAPAAALFFTAHHSIALSVYLAVPAVVICSSGVFLGGWIWSMIYSRYGSVWPAYLSHAIVDLCIFLIGASILFA